MNPQIRELLTQLPASPETDELQNLLTKQEEVYAARDKMLGHYRELVGKIAINADKANAWYMAKAWAPFWRDMAFDLNSEAEQQAFLFR